MKTADFDYDLPPERIAQLPLDRRDASRLMLLARRGGAVEHHVFSELPRLLAGGDLLVFNDTRVIPARLWGRKPTGGQVEVLLLRRVADGQWRALLRASRMPREGTFLALGEEVRLHVERRAADDWLVRLETPDGDDLSAVERLGRMPLPPYIARQRKDPRDAVDRERYQTVFARHAGAVAAPTAGLHFTSECLHGLAERGIAHAFVTLHVGAGTFLPVRKEQLEHHRLHEEDFRLSPETAQAVQDTRRRGGRVVAVGTTVVRVLESTARGDGCVEAGQGRCDLFIRPGFRFAVVDALITNFHLPRSTLLMLVSAFAGREHVLAAYAEAVRRNYRFYSYGDAMLVIDR